MIKHLPKGLGILVVLFLLGGLRLLPAQSKRASTSPQASTHHGVGTATQTPSPDKVTRFMRDKFGVPDKVAIIVEPFHDSADPGFWESNITSDDGLNTKTSKQTRVVGVSRDGRYLVVSYVPAGNGTIFPLGADANNEISRHFRELFHFPGNVTVAVGTYKNSPLPGFQKVPITLSDGKNSSEPSAYVTRDHRYVLLGDIFELGVDPRRAALRALILQNQPDVGPKDAPITIVEFADLECPTCARAHEFLEKNLLPNYAGKVRMVFKEFPLPMHEWALPAAIANQCAYRINRADYLAYRSLIFAHQSDFETIKGNASAVRDKLIDLGQQAGLDKLQLSGCFDSKASLPRVEENVKEGKSIDVSSTPTFFINGKILIGAQPEAFYEAVNEALVASKRKK